MNGSVFGRLLMMFTCRVNNTAFPVALVHPYDAPLGRPVKKDKHLGFYRVRARPPKNAEFISVHSIIRGVRLVQDFAKEGDFFVHDLVDDDIFLRIKEFRRQRPDL